MKNNEGEKEVGKLLGLGDLDLTVIFAAYLHIYKAYTFYDYTVIQNDLKTLGISYCDT